MEFVSYPILITDLLLCILLIITIWRFQKRSKISFGIVCGGIGGIALVIGTIFEIATALTLVGTVIHFIGFLLLCSSVIMMIWNNPGSEQCNPQEPIISELERLVQEKSTALEMTNQLLTNEMEVRASFEANLQESETRYRSLVESTSDIIWEADSNGRCTYVSPRVESILGYMQDEITGHFLSDFIPPEDVPRFSEGFIRIIEKKSSFSGNASIFLHKDGHQVILESNGIPVLDTSGKIRGYRGISRDITERKQIDDALRLASKKLNLLSSITRHDILNSLTAMLGYLRFSQESVQDTEMVSGYLNKMMQITEMIQHQIEFTRYYEDIGIKAPEWQDIESIIKQAVHSLKLDGVAIEIQVHGLLVFCDALIDKVFYNLIENTIRHGEHVTTITISCLFSGTNLVLVYADNGVGVAERDKANIFLRGFGKHTGFGMFLTKEILSITGISITEMGTRGEGVRFEMIIPEGKYQLGEMQSS